LSGAPEADPVLCEKYRELARQHLGALPALFTKFTGLFSHVAWAPRGPGHWGTRDLPTHSWLCRGVVAGHAAALAGCRRCAARHLALALKSGHQGHRFTCFLGVHNYWLPIILRGCLVAIAFVQAPALPPSGRQGPCKSLHPNRALPSRIAGASRQARGATKRLSRSEFCGAARLLRLVFQHVETAALAELRRADLTQAQQAVVELQTVATRLRRDLNGLVPAFNKTPPLLNSEKHTDRAVHAALAYVDQHYSRPFTLRQCAGQLRLNAAYLSAQFSRAVGVPFKTYLTEVRVEKARELLSDPAATIADIACAVGYASENRFRLAFKHVTGLSPKLWRETLRMERRATP